MSSNGPDLKRIEGILLDRFGVPVKARPGNNTEGTYVDLIPEDLDEREGFIIRVQIGWRSLKATFIPGNFSAHLLRIMGVADREKKALFNTFASSSIHDGASITMRINDFPINPCSISDFTSEWSQLSIGLSLIPFDPSLCTLEDSIIDWGGKLFAMVIALLPIEEVLTDDNEIQTGMPEGSIIRVEVNRYERNQLNRAACIAVRGCICTVCGFDFGEVYGQYGTGFIHIHHIVPVSQLGDDYLINPLKDLVPVCPNCHAMLHTVNPPLTVEELQKIINSRKLSKI